MEVIVTSEKELRGIIGDAVRAVLNHEMPEATKPDGKEYVYGLAGLAELIGASKVTAQKLKNSGKIPFTQVGRKIIFEKTAVLDALNENKKGGKL